MEFGLAVADFTWAGRLPPSRTRDAQPATGRASKFRLRSVPAGLRTAWIARLAAWWTRGRVLRARTPDHIDQEVHALLVTYQAIRTAIGRAVLASLMPGRRPRCQPRIVKRALSKYRALGPRVSIVSAIGSPWS